MPSAFSTGHEIECKVMGAWDAPCPVHCQFVYEIRYLSFILLTLLIYLKHATVGGTGIIAQGPTDYPRSFAAVLVNMNTSNVSTSVDTKSTKFKASHMWNSLPERMRKIENFNSFKTELTYYLSDNAIT